MSEGNLDQRKAESARRNRMGLSQPIASNTSDPTSVDLGSLGLTLTELQATVAEITQRYSDLAAQYEHVKATCQNYQDLFEHAPDGYLITNATGVIQDANRLACTLLEKQPDALIGTQLTDSLPAAAQLLCAEMMAQLLQGEVVSALEVPLPLRSATLEQPTVILLKVNALRDETNQIDRFRWVLHDITAQKQLESALQHQIEQQRLIATMTQRIRQSLDPKEILNNTVIEVQQILQADRVVVYSVDDQVGALVVAEALGSGWRSLLDTRLSSTTAEHYAEILRRTQAHVVHDIGQAGYRNEMVTELQQQQVRAMLLLPIVREEQLLGMLSVQQCDQVRHWRSPEVELLRHLTEQLAIALQQSRLYQQAQQLNADLEQQIRRRTEQMEQVLMYESMLKRITDKVRDSLDESQIIQSAVKELTLVLGLAGCNSALYDLEQNTSTIRYEYTNSIPTFYGRVAQMDDSPEIYRQLKGGLYFQFCSLYPNPQRGRVAMLVCPIFVDPNSSEGMEQTVLGDLWLIHHKEYLFNEFEIRMVQQVANQCAIAIRQARLYRAAQVQVQELEHLNQLKDQFLSTVSHELRTPIANVKMAIHMLKTAPSPEKQQKYLNILESELAREAELIDDLLDLQRLEESVFPISVEEIFLQKWLPELVEPFRSRTLNYEQSLQISCPTQLAPLWSDPTILRRILAELLNNACKYTPRGHTIELNVHEETTQAGEVTVFQVRNQAEIPVADLPHIFEKFYRVIQVDRYKHGGTGLGLALVQKLVEQLDGTIHATSENGWTTFTVRVPMRQP